MSTRLADPSRDYATLSPFLGPEGLRSFDHVRLLNALHARACPLRRYERIILRARSAAIAHVLSLTKLSNVVAYVCRAPPGQDRHHARSPRQSPAAPSLGDTARGRA